jgi:hypothetical protein
MGERNGMGAGFTFVGPSESGMCAKQVECTVSGHHGHATRTDLDLRHACVRKMPPEVGLLGRPPRPPQTSCSPARRLLVQA